MRALLFFLLVSVAGAQTTVIGGATGAPGPTGPTGVFPGTLSGNDITLPGSLATKTGPTFNVKAWGAKGDERFVSDAAMTAASSTLTSATAAFSTADTGKTVTVEAGARGAIAGTYVSGGTITGSINQICTVGTFTGGAGSGAVAVVKLTGTNAIASGSPLQFTAIGTGYTSGPTGATLSGTLVFPGNPGTSATCSGTAVVSVTGFYPLPITATATYVNATTITLSSTAVTTVTGAKAAIGTDDSAVVQSVIQAASDQGGGTVYFPHANYLLLSQITFPRSSGAEVVPIQNTIRLLGDGERWDGEWDCSLTGFIDANCYLNPAISVLDLRYAGTVAKMETRGKGSLTIEHLSLEDRGYDSLPFLQSTNTTIFARDLSWMGSGPGGAASRNDAIVLGGGTSTALGSLSTSPFQGYGTVIERNYFGRIGRGVYGRNYANSVVVQNNTWSSSCGGPTAIEFDGTGGFSSANVWANNLIEVQGYQFGATFRNASKNFGVANATWDGGTQFISGATTIGTSTNDTCAPCILFNGVLEQGTNNLFYYFDGAGFFGRPVFHGVGAGQLASFVGPAASGSNAWIEILRGATTEGYVGYGSAGALVNNSATDAFTIRGTTTTHITASNDALKGLTISTTGEIRMPPRAFSALGTVLAAGYQLYCTDCTAAATCAGSGSGHMAVSNGTAWTCQ